MSHASGKIEVVGLDDNYIYMRYHRAADPRNAGKFIVARRNDSGYWFDDFEIISESDSDIALTPPDEIPAVPPVIKTEISNHSTAKVPVSV